MFPFLWTYPQREDSRALQIGTDLPPFSEKSGLAGAPAVEFLQYSDIPKTLETLINAFRDDPLESYLLRTPDTKGSWKFQIFEALRKATIVATLKRYIKAGRAFTVNKGNSVILHSPAVDPTSPRLPVSSWEKLFVKLSNYALSPQQKRRTAEWGSKIKAAMDAHVGDRADDYFSVDGLATHPDFQGHGYGSALVNTISQLADEADRPCWLGSSNMDNNGFYEYLGYIAVAEIIVGDDDPDWDGEPIIALLMIRPAWFGDDKVAPLA